MKKSRLILIAALLIAVMINISTPSYALDTEGTPFSVEYHANGGSGTMTPYLSLKGYPHTLSPNGFTPPAGKEFSGWLVDGVLKQPGDLVELPQTSPLIVKAQWKDTAAVNYKISFDKNGGTGTMADVSVKQGESYELPGNEFTPPADKVFYAWEVNGVEKEVGSTFIPTVDIVIKALWEDEEQDPEELIVERIYGDDRIKTALEVSSDSFSTAENAVIARSDDYPDSLSASVLAKQLKGPILLTRSGVLADGIEKELTRLKVKKVYIVGGESAVSEKVEQSLAKKERTVERIYGDNRYETSAEIANEVMDLAREKGRAVIASGEEYADALAISPYAAAKGYPILLVRSNALHPTIEKVIEDRKIADVEIVGGTRRITKDLEKDLPKILKRYQGDNRYGTAVKIAEELFPGATAVYLARGNDFADALSIGPVAAEDGWPILLTTPKKAPKELLDFVKKEELARMIVVGGPAAVSDEVIKEIEQKAAE